MERGKAKRFIGGTSAKAQSVHRTCLGNQHLSLLPSKEEEEEGRRLINPGMEEKKHVGTQQAGKVARMKWMWMRWRSTDRCVLLCHLWQGLPGRDGAPGSDGARGEKVSRLGHITGASFRTEPACIVWCLDWTMALDSLFVRAEIYSKANQAFCMQSNPVTLYICSNQKYWWMQPKYLQEHMSYFFQDTGVSSSVISWCDPFTLLMFHCYKCNRRCCQIGNLTNVCKALKWGSVLLCSLNQFKVIVKITGLKHHWECKNITAGSHWVQHLFN